jgi:phosphate transport system protein
MAIRSHFRHDLLVVQERLGWLGDMVQMAVARATWALLNRDVGAARQVVAGDVDLDALRFGIEEQALQVIARQQPFAGDLRLLSGLVHSATELERIGDYAKAIARIVLHIQDLPLLLPPCIGDMVREVRAMLEEAMRAMLEHDPAAAARLEQSDDLVDSLYRQATDQLVMVMRDQPDRIEVGTYMLSAAHHLERIADRAVNIGEQAMFIAGRTKQAHLAVRSAMMPARDDDGENITG